MKYFHLEETDEGLAIEESVRGRLAAAASRFAVTFPLILLGLSFFFIPDYIGRYAAAEPVVGMFWLIVFAVALLIGFILAILRFVRLERWVFLRESRELQYETQGLYGAGQGASVKLEKIRRGGLVLRGRPLESTLVVELADGHREILARSRVAPKELEAIAHRLETFLDSLSIGVEWHREAAGSV